MRRMWRLPAARCAASERARLDENGTAGATGSVVECSWQQARQRCRHIQQAGTVRTPWLCCRFRLKLAGTCSRLSSPVPRAGGSQTEMSGGKEAPLTSSQWMPTGVAPEHDGS